MLPLLIKVTSLPLDTPPPGPALPSEVRLIAAARFQQSNPFPKEEQNFFRPRIALSLRNAVAPLEETDYLTELCRWTPPRPGPPRVHGKWHCHKVFDFLGLDPVRKGTGWASLRIEGFGRGGLTFYLFQYPFDWARQNCEAAGGRFKEAYFGSECIGLNKENYVYWLGHVAYRGRRRP